MIPQLEDGMNESLEPAVCKLCSSALGEAILVHDQPDRFELAVGIGKTNFRRYWRVCIQCGSAMNCHDQAHKQKLLSLASQYYEVDFANSDIREKYDLVMSLPPSKSDNYGRVDRVIQALKKWSEPYTSNVAPAVLDIGAGTGVFLSRFLANAEGMWRGVAIEPDPHAAEHLRSLGRFDVIKSTFDGQPEIVGFNLVTVNKVLEHIENPKLFLAQLVGAVHPIDGLIYIEVPDVLTIGRRSSTDNILGSLHHHLYSPLGLIHLVQSVGLVPLDVGRVFEPSGKLTCYVFASPSEAIDQMTRQN